MDVFTAIKERRSCRSFLPDTISDEVIEKILEAAVWAPSPANNQPWDFIVITNNNLKEKIWLESDKCKKMLFEKSGWKWLDRYKLDFVKEAPVVIVVVADPKKTGADMFLEEAAWPISTDARRRSRTCSWLPMRLAWGRSGSPFSIKTL